MQFLKFSLLSLGLCLFTTLAWGQSFLPKGFAPGEREAMPDYIKTVQNRFAGGDTPPAPVRTMAEWEELDGLIITWTQFRGILTEIVRAAREETNVIIVCSSPTQVQNYLTDRGVDISSNVQFVAGNFNSIWVRDYGPNTAYLNGIDSLVIIDWIYNRPRYQDDLVPYLISANLSIPLYATSTPPNDLVNTGGNFMADGLGRAFSSKLVLTENGPNNTYGQSHHSEEEVNGIMNDFMGIDPYIKMEVLPYDAIHHIDMHMKLLDERTLLVGEYPLGIADGPQIEANIQYVISNFEAAWGRDFEVIRMPMPPDASGRYPHQGGHYRTYTNSVIVNKTILIPTYDERYDTTAFRIWEEIMPGYNLVGINCNAIIPLSGALHCITKELGSRDPLQISHARLADIPAGQAGDYLVEAVIRHKSGIAGAQVYYTTDLSNGFIPVEMSLTNAQENIWAGYIPAQEPGSQVYYYLHAQAESGKEQMRPMPAPEGYFDFYVEELSTGTIDLSKPGLQMESIYPNPASAITVVPTRSKKSTAVRIELRDVQGRLVEVLFDGELSPGLQNHFLFADRYSPGTYFVQLWEEDLVAVQKVEIVR